MTYPVTLSETELSAVNQILGAVGQAPITTLDQTNPDVAIAYDTLVEVNRETQGEGWVFNTEREYPFTPDTNGEILIPGNVLMLDLSDLPQNRGQDVVQRGGKLYNKTDHTFSWSDFTPPVYCDVVWLFEFVDTPQPFKDYISAKASVIASTKMIGDPTQYKLLKERELSTRAMIVQYECEQGNYSMFGFPNGQNFYTSYQPYTTLAR